MKGAVGAYNLGKVVFCIVAALCLSSCALLPAEEELPSAPFIYSFQEYGYKTEAVERGDLVNELSLTVQYQPSTEEKLYFVLDGERIDQIYIAKGDTVKKGQLIAELDMGSIPSEISTQKNRIKEMQLQQTHQGQTLQLLKKQNQEKLTKAREKVEAAKKALESAQEEETEEKKEALSAAERERDALLAQTSAAEREQQGALTALTENLTIQKEKLAELEEKKKQRQVYAGISGTVQSVISIGGGSISSTSQPIAVIQDYSTSVFVLEGENCRHFAMNEEVEIVLKNGESKKAKAMSKTEGEKPRVAFALDTPDPSLGKGSAGTVYKLMEKKADVLYVPLKAVVTSGETNYLYILDENSLRSLREVKLGMETQEYVEILEGVKEGDRVILS